MGIYQMESEARWGLAASAQVKRDASIIVAAYLSEHPPDDEESVTVEWFQSIGGKNKVVHGMADDVFNLPIRKTGWYIQFGRNSRCLSIGCGIMGFTVKLNATRGNVRRLCEALGIELKEGGG